MFERVDLLLTPTCPTVAPPVDEGVRNVRYTRYTTVAAFTGVPAISIPAGTGWLGLPVGVHLMGPLGGDRLVLGAAARLEAALGSANGQMTLERRSSARSEADNPSISIDLVIGSAVGRGGSPDLPVSRSAAARRRASGRSELRVGDRGDRPTLDQVRVVGQLGHVGDRCDGYLRLDEQTERVGAVPSRYPGSDDLIDGVDVGETRLVRGEPRVVAEVRSGSASEGDVRTRSWSVRRSVSSSTVGGAVEVPRGRRRCPIAIASRDDPELVVLDQLIAQEREQRVEKAGIHGLAVPAGGAIGARSATRTPTVAYRAATELARAIGGSVGGPSACPVISANPLDRFREGPEPRSLAIGPVCPKPDRRTRTRLVGCPPAPPGRDPNAPSSRAERIR